MFTAKLRGRSFNCPIIFFQVNMSNQLRASELLREAANLLNQPRNSADIENVSPSVTLGTTPGNSVSITPSIFSSTHGTTNSTQIRAATRAIFAPYGSQRGRRRAQTTIPPITFWTHKFCVLANCSEVLTYINQF